MGFTLGLDNFRNVSYFINRYLFKLVLKIVYLVQWYSSILESLPIKKSGKKLNREYSTSTSCTILLCNCTSCIIFFISLRALFIYESNNVCNYQGIL